MSLCSFDDNKELIKLSPVLLYEIAMDIQVTDKWKTFANLIGFTTEQILMLQVNPGDRFPAENVMYHWFSKSPKTKNLAEHLCSMLLEKPLTRLNGHLDSSTYKSLMNKLEKNRKDYSKNLSQDNGDGCLENLTIFTDDTIFMKPKIQPQLSSTSTSSTADSGTPEPGIVNITLHDPSIPRSSLYNNFSADTNDKENNHNKETSKSDLSYNVFLKKLLKVKSTEFYSSEFIEPASFDGSLQGYFSSHFPIKLRVNQFYVRAFYLPKILQSKKDKKKLYNIIWCSQNFKLNHFPILSGFCFYENYLFLLFPLHKSHSLYDILHRPHDADNKTISAIERLNIIIDVGKALGYLHNSLPFGGYHGQVNSHNVLISDVNVLLTGFDKFCTQDPDYVKGLETIKKPNIDSEDCFRKDKVQYLELICETWWNVQPSIGGGNHFESCLIKDIAGHIIINPKVNYDNWNYEHNEEIRGLIKRFSEESKDSGSIAEIVEELSECIHQTHQSLQPPPYDEFTELYCELKVKEELTEP